MPEPVMSAGSACSTWEGTRPMILATNPINTGDTVSFTAEQMDALTWAMYTVASAIADELGSDDLTPAFCQPVSLVAAYIDLYRALEIEPPQMLIEAIEDCQQAQAAA